jgi:hypothetical protein
MDIGNISKFKKTNTCVALVAGISNVVEQFDPPSAFVSLLDKAGVETRLTLSAEALRAHLPTPSNAPVMPLLLNRAYKFTFPSSCVSDLPVSLGYNARLQLKASKYALHIESDVTPIDRRTLPFSFDALETLQDAPLKSFVDVLGVVTACTPGEGGLSKTILTLTSGSLECQVDLLDGHQQLTFTVSDKVAFRRLQVVEYRGKKTLQSHFTTLALINPSGDKFEVAGADGPVRKALRTSFGPLVSVQAANVSFESLRTSSKGETQLTLHAHFLPFDAEGAFKEAPFYTTQTGEDRLRLRFRLADESGTLNFHATTLQTSTATTLLGVPFETVLRLWESCEEESQKPAYMNMLNNNAQKVFKMLLIAKPQAWRDSIQINVILEAAESVDG